MTYQELIKHFGTQVKAAAVIGITQPRIASWKKKGRIPVTRQCQIQLITGGVLKADTMTDKPA